MNKDEVKEKLQVIFREVFDDEELVITDELSADDVDEWDSFTNST